MSENNKQLSILQDALFKLGDEMSQLLVREHQILKEEMSQVRVLVSDAVKNLDSNFRSLNARATDQANILNKVAKTGRIDEHQQKKIADISKEISSHTSTTIRTLQFDDIVQQLAGHTYERIARMQRLFTELDKKLKKIKKGDLLDDLIIEQQVRAMKDEVKEFRAKLEKENPVKQRSMEAGKIELF